MPQTGGRAAIQSRSSAICYYRAMPSPRLLPPPWSIEERQESFIVKDANGQQIFYLYFEDEPQRQMSMKRLSERLRDSMTTPRSQFAHS
jgi:hypothetical protein